MWVCGTSQLTSKYTTGVWFGDPRSHISEGRKVWIEGVDADKVVSAETLSPSPDKLAVNLLMVLFSMTEVASGNCTTPKRSDIHLLDQKMIGAIRCKYTALHYY